MRNLTPEARMRVAASLTAAALALVACASTPAPAAGPAFEAQVERANTWFAGYFVDPIMAVVSACAALSEGQQAFNARLTGAGFTPAPAWRASPNGYLEAPQFTVYTGPDVRLRVGANRVDATTVCAIGFEGSLGPAIWEAQKRAMPTRWKAYVPSPAGQAVRYLKEAGVETSVLMFTEANRRDPPLLIIEFHTEPAARGVTR